MNKPGGSLLLTSVVMLLCLRPPLQAFAQPTNDFCTNAIEISLDTVYAINTSTATSTDDPTNVCSAPFGKGVWFHFRALRNGILTLSTCGSDFDTLISIYQGTCDALSFYSCADDNGPACPGNQASWSIPVTYNTSFYIVVGGKGGTGGNLQFTASISAPTNDQCDAAIALTNAVAYQMNMFGTTATNDPPNCRLNTSPGVWFKYTPTNTGPLTISTAGSGFSPDIEVFTGNCANLVKTLCGIIDPTLRFQATNGITYLIFVSDFDNSSETDYAAQAQLKIEVQEGTISNDSCSGAIALTNGVPYFASIIAATSTNDPPPACGGAANDSTWYTFTPTSNGVATISTCGSEFETVLQIYTGNCNSLVPLPGGCGRYGVESGCELQASISFEATANTNYYILAGSVLAGGIGNLEIQATLSPPLNDRCQNAIPMQDGIIYTRNTVASTTNGDPPLPNFANGVWYTYSPASNGIVTITTCGSDFPTAMQVYSGSCNALATVPEGFSSVAVSGCPTSRAAVSFEAVGGVTYYVLVGSYGNLAGNLQIQATLWPSLNDHCQNAIAMQDGIVYSRNTEASTSSGESNTICGYGFGRGVWYTYTPASNGVVTVSTCGSDFNTLLQVYTGNCGGLIAIPDACNGGFGPACPSNRASVVFEAVGGITYHILAGGYGSLAGNLQIQATLSPSLNDRCENAIAMQDGVVYARNTATSTSTGDPSSSCGYPIGRGVWYTYTPASNGVVTVSTCGSDFDTALQIFTGQCGAFTHLNDGVDRCNNGGGPACRSNQASIVFEGTAGVTYHILVGGNGDVTGHLQIQAFLSPSLPNDHCEGAIVLTNGIPYAENTATATSSNGVYFYDDKGVWFSFTPPANGMLTVSTCGSDYWNELDVFTGGCNSMTVVPDGVNWGNGLVPCPTHSSSVVIPVSAGTNYLILVSAYDSGGFGNLQIQATFQPPLPNDQCSGAIDISDGATYSADTTIATSTGDVTNGCVGNVKGIWYRLTPLATDPITIHLQTTNLHPNLQLFQGSCGQLNPLKCAYNYYGYHADLTFTGMAGQTYFIEAGAFYPGAGILNISAGAFPPFNDQWGNATPIVSGLEYTMNTTYASSTNDPVPLCDTTAGHGVWYLYTPNQDAQVAVATCASDFETVLQVYSYDGSSLTPVACNDGFGPVCATNRASLSFFGKTGTNYFIFVAGKNGAFGNLSISVNGPPMANDTCDTAIEMTEDVVCTTNTEYASSVGDVFPVTKGVWYRFTPTRPGLLRLSTCGSDFNTAFNVYTGTCNALTYFTGAATAQGIPCAENRASVEFVVSLGTTYYIDVGGTAGTSGNLSIVATMPIPTNDTCAGAIPLSNGLIYRMNNVNATEAGDPTPTCQTNFEKGVWFTFTPPMSGTVSLSTCSGDFDTILQVYTGSCGALTPLANSCNDDAGPDCDSVAASVHFHGDAGVTYWILAGGYPGSRGNLAIEANVLPVLTLQRAGTNSVLSWPYQSFHSFYPEFATNLNPPILWKPVPQLTGTAYTNGNLFTTNSTLGNPIYFRLRNRW